MENTGMINLQSLVQTSPESCLVSESRVSASNDDLEIKK